MAGLAAYKRLPGLARLKATLSRRSATRPATAAPPAGPGAKPMKPRGRTYYSDETTTVVGRTLISPNGTFRIADLTRVRPVPQIEPRERARDAAGMSVFAVLLLAAVALVSFGTYVLMSSKFGGATGAAVLGTAIVSAVILAGYAAVLWSRWRAVYERDPRRYRHVIVAVHRGESVALTPDLPYETASRIVAVLQKVQRRIPGTTPVPRKEAAA